MSECNEGAKPMNPPKPSLPWVRGLLAASLCVAFAGVSHGQISAAARVNGEAITFERLDRQYEDLLRERRLHMARLQNPEKAKAMKREALESLIRIELMWQKAKATGVVASDEEVDRTIAEVRGRYRSETAFVAGIESSGFSERSYRVHTRKLLSGDRYAQRVVERDVQVTDKDIQAFYDINPRLFRRGEQVKVRQILIVVPGDAKPEQKAQARRRIDELLARARAGESFEALARQQSDDPTRQWGGVLDPFGRGERPQALEDAAFALAPGAISEVVETPAGWHILQLEERMAAASVPLDAARERIREYLHQSRGQEAIAKEVEQLRALAKVELLTPL
jgi:parvulin-like peptidyl-prolyl isomerase